MEYFLLGVFLTILFWAVSTFVKDWIKDTIHQTIVEYGVREDELDVFKSEMENKIYKAKREAKKEIREEIRHQDQRLR